MTSKTFDAKAFVTAIKFSVKIGKYLIGPCQFVALATGMALDEVHLHTVPAMVHSIKAAGFTVSEAK